MTRLWQGLCIENIVAITQSKLDLREDLGKWIAKSNIIDSLETTVRLAVPLQWANAELMMEKCGCDLLLTTNAREPELPFGVASTPKPK